MKMKKFIAVLSVATMAAGLAVGCGSSDSGSSDDKSSKGDWDSSNDITIVSREDGSGTRGAFIELFGIEEKKDGEKVDMTTDELSSDQVKDIYTGNAVAWDEVVK